MARWKQLHNEKIHNFHSLADISRMIKSMMTGWRDHVANMGGVRIPYKSLIGKSERKRPLGSPWYGWETNIKMDIKDRTREWGRDSLDSW
jgi:hypothetical protein